MTDAEISQAENAARAHLNRIRTIEARIGPVPRKAGDPYSGCVPALCETILKLTAELKQRKGRAP